MNDSGFNPSIYDFLFIVIMIMMMMMMMMMIIIKIMMIVSLGCLSMSRVSDQNGVSQA